MKPERQIPDWAKGHDGHAQDGITSEGFRVVRAGGRVKFASVWWFGEALKEHVGETVFCQGQDYWQQEMDVSEAYRPSNHICRVTRVDAS